MSSAKASASAEGGAQTFRFQISPTGGVAKIGKFYLYYPSRSVCDPDQSAYGPTEWEKDCPTLRRPITIRAKFWVEDGHTFADFEPNIRFDPDKKVFLTAYVPEIRGREVNDELTSTYAIGYTTRQGTTRYFIDEASVDPTLATIFLQRDGTATGMLVRRVKHFSGYYVRSGRVCDETTGECTDGTTATAY